MTDNEKFKEGLQELDQRIKDSKRGSGLLEACKLAYRKHHLGDESIGWEELGTILLDAICNEIGDDGYQKWLEDLRND